MLSENDLRELVDFVIPDPVVSVYLNTNPSDGNSDAHKRQLKSMIRDLNLTKDVEAIERFFDHEYNWNGRGVAVFSCNSQNFFRSYPLGVPVRNLVQISDRPSVKPLAALVDIYGGYGVVLVDKQGARLFSFHMGQMREQEGMLGEEVRRVKHGQAHHTVDEQIDRNMKDAVEFAIQFFEGNHVRRVLIGGTEENVISFRKLLPKAWQSLVMGTFQMPITASQNEVAARAIELGEKSEKERETHRVEQLITAAAKGADAVIGLEATLEAANNNRIQTLVLTEGFRKNAFRCKSTGQLTLKPEDTCGSDAEVEKVYDVVEVLVNQVMRSGGEIEVVFVTPGLTEVGDIGAFLRY